jgi:hypothetical protein
LGFLDPLVEYSLREITRPEKGTRPIGLNPGRKERGNGDPMVRRTTKVYWLGHGR